MKNINQWVKDINEKVENKQAEIKRKRILYNKIAIVSICFSLMAIVTVPNVFTYVNKNEHSVQNNNTTSINKQQCNDNAAILENLSVIVYSPKTSGKALTVNYLNETVATKLTPKISVLMETYSPVLSTVPGYPIKFVLEQQDIKQPYEMIIVTDNGGFLNWDSKSGVVKDRGKQCILKESDTLFWSPISGGKIVTDTKITVTMVQNQNTIGKQILNIHESNSNYYVIAEDVIATQ